MHRNSWLIGIVALALAAGPASAQDGANRAASRREAGAGNAPSPGVKFTNRLASTAVFIENKGQFDPRVKFQARIGGKTAWLTAEGIVFDVTRRATDDASADRVPGTPGPGTALRIPGDASATASSRAWPESQTLDRLVFAEDLVRAKCCSQVEGRELQPGVYNYLQGRDSSQWRTNVRGFAEVVYRDMWPGIDLRVYGNGPNLEQEFVVRPGGDLNLVQVAYRGVDKLSIAEDGSLEVATAFGTLRETKPAIFQQIAGKRAAVEGHYRLTSQTAYSFAVPAPNPLYALVIDPTLLYSTYLGGSAGNNLNLCICEMATGIAVDASGNAYVTGNTTSTDFPIATGAFQTSPGGSFITKLNATGSALVYSTYLGAGTTTTAIAVDSAGYSYVTGVTGRGLPTTPNAYWPTDSTQQCAPIDFFVTKVNSTGDQLLYSSCLNTSGVAAKAIAVDSNGRAYIAGGAEPGLPTTANAYQPSYPGSGVAAFVTVFDTTLSGTSSLVYSTYLGTSYSSGYAGIGAEASGVAVDSFGKIYIAGWTFPGFPTTPGVFQPSHAGCSTSGGGRCSDVFVAKLDPSASGSQTLLYSTYIGGTGEDTPAAIAVDNSGNAYVTGNTFPYNNSDSGTFPVTPGAYNTAAGRDIFIAKLNAGGSKLIYSTYLGASGSSSGIAVDISGNAYVTGYTTGVLPVTPDAFQSTFQGGLGPEDAFLSGLNPAGSGLVYSSFLGGIGDDAATAVAVDQVGDVYIAGWTTSPGFPVSPTAFQPTRDGTGDAFVTKFPLGPSSVLSVTGIAPVAGGTGGTVTPEIFGAGLREGATAQLNCAGQPIAGKNPSVGTGGRFLNAVFDLTAATPGTCDLVVTNPGGTSVTLPNAFSIQKGGAPNIRVDVNGLAAREAAENVPVSPTNSVVFVTASNTGIIDSTESMVWLPPHPPFVLTSASPSGVVDLAGASSDFDVWISGPMASGSSQVFTSTATTLAPINNGDPALTAQVCVAPVPLTGRDWGKWGICMANIASSISETLQACNADKNCANLNQLAIEDAELDDLGPFVFAGQVASCLASVLQCLDNLHNQAYANAIGICFSSSEIQGSAAPICISSSIPYFAPTDPNGLVGPSGVGGQRWMAGPAALTYGISFSNEPTAPVPAQQVVVTQPLSANVDLTTLKLLAVNLPNGTSSVQVPIPSSSFNPGAGVNEFTTVADLRPVQSLLVNVDATLNPNTHTLTWTLASIDPSTGAPPVNPLVGLLPPGLGGSVAFSVTPTQGLATGTQIPDQASVVFDVNAPLSTPTWTNTIDNTPPVSAVVALPSAQTTSCFRPQWTATDVGSGVQGTTIFVSDTGGAYTPWLTNTTSASSIYNGVAGHTYAFYSQATDLVGNVEATHPSPDASTSVPAGASCNGRPTIAASIASNSLSGTTETLALQLTNNGNGNAQNIKITSVSLRTLVGTGSVTLSSPATPIGVGSLAAGASIPETLTLNAPATVKEYSITEAGTVQDLAGNTYSFSIAQAIIP